MNGFIFNIMNKCYEIKLRFKESLPVNFVYIDDFMRAPFDILKRNEVLAVGIDGREGVKSVDLNFLNHRAVFYTGSMRLIMKAKPVVLPTFHLRNDDNTHTMIIEKPMELIDTGRRDEDIYDNMSKFINILEEKVYQYPWLYADAFCISDTFLIPLQNDSP